MQSILYSKQPNLVFGFHGCDKNIIQDIVLSNSKHLGMSNNSYDWLGKGIYFWQNDPLRAFEWAKNKFKDNAGVIGAVIDLGECLDFCERTSIELLKQAHILLKQEYTEQGIAMKENRKPDDSGFKLIRDLDCAVIERLHVELDKQNTPFETVKGYFQEGKDVYEGAGVKMYSHIQICVRNTANIKAYFIPRSK